MNPLIQLKNPSPLILIALLLACLPLSPIARAVVPAPDGGYLGQNTAEGQSALLHLAGGTYNTALGWSSLGFNFTGNNNTAIGAGALLANTADNNTATGAAALLSNTTANANTANGAFALLSNTTGSDNTATGYQALFNNTSSDNTANGASALFHNSTGLANTASGQQALYKNTTGQSNTASGVQALFNNTTGGDNIALGVNAGNGVTTANNVICIGADGNNVDNSCYIGQIFGATSSGGVAVFVNSNGRLGTATSSRRFKDDIKVMDQASEALFKLKPVSFRYKKEIDPARMSQFGLVAEEVEKVNPDLVVRDKDGKPYSVRYDQVNAMLLNEFLKEHHTVQEQGATIARLEQQVAALTAGLQKVSAQLATASPSRGGLEASKPAPQVVNNP
jgi:Chaperone of endosialidase